MTKAQHFAPYYRRFIAVAVDYLFVFFGAAGIQSYGLEPVGIEGTRFQLLLFVFAVAYFALRSLLLIGGVVGAMTLLDVPTNPNYLFLAVPVIAALFAGVFCREDLFQNT